MAKKKGKKHVESDHIFLIPVLFLLIIFVVGGSIYFTKVHFMGRTSEMIQKYIPQLHEMSAAMSSDQVRLLEAVGEKMNLPDGKPLITTINFEGDDLGAGSFFADAKNGDKLIYFENEEQVIIFRPSSGKVISEGLMMFY